MEIEILNANYSDLSNSSRMIFSGLLDRIHVNLDGSAQISLPVPYTSSNDMPDTEI